MSNAASGKGAKAKEEYTLEIDNIIDSLLKVRSYRPGKTVNLPEKDVLALCLSAREVFLSQPALLELEAPLKICGTSCRAWGGGGGSWGSVWA